MTKIMTDASTPLNQANLNKFAASDGTVQNATWGGRLTYNGAAWVMQAAQGQGVGQSGLITLTWAGASNRLEVDYSGCTNPFTGTVTVVASPAATADNNYSVKAVGLNSTTWFAKFYDNVTDALITTEDTRMDFCFQATGQV